MIKVYHQLVVYGDSIFNITFGGKRSCEGEFMYLGEQTTFWSSTRMTNVSAKASSKI